MGLAQLLIRGAAAALLLVLAAGLQGCVAAAGGAGASDVVATVGGTPITAAEVERLRVPAEGPPVLRAGEARADTGTVALARATRDLLFAKEAEERGLPGADRTALIRALIDQERQRTAGWAAADLTETEVHVWYEEHRDRFDDVERAEVAWAQIADAELAHRLLDEAEGADEQRFSAMVERFAGRGVVASGRAALDHDGEGADVSVARVAFALRRAGDIGLVEDDGGRWWLVRVAAVAWEEAVWTGELASRVRTALLWEREQQHLERLASELERKWPVRLEG